MKKRAKIHQLKTDKPSQIAICKFGERYGLFYGDEPSIEDGLQNQHLYFTTDEEVDLKTNWVIHTDAAGETHIIAPNTWEPNIKFCSKIIGSSDKELNLPEPTKEFIQEYCRKGGIDEVDVEYERRTIQGEWKPALLPSEWGSKGENPTRPKITKDNKMIIHPVQKNVFSRDEVKSLIMWLKNDTNKLDQDVTSILSEYENLSM